jgi:hypothetical protein
VSFNLRVLFLVPKLLLWSNQDYWMIIVDFCCLIIDPCMVFNLFVRFIKIWSSLEFLSLESLWMFICVLHVYFFWVLICFYQNFWVVVFLTSSIYFWFFFSGQTYVFGLVHNRTKYLWSTKLGQLSRVKIKSMAKALFG